MTIPKAINSNSCWSAPAATFACFTHKPFKDKNRCQWMAWTPWDDKGGNVRKFSVSMVIPWANEAYLHRCWLVVSLQLQHIAVWMAQSMMTRKNKIKKRMIAKSKLKHNWKCQTGRVKWPDGESDYEGLDMASTTRRALISKVKNGTILFQRRFSCMAKAIPRGLFIKIDNNSNFEQNSKTKQKQRFVHRCVWWINMIKTFQIATSYKFLKEQYYEREKNPSSLQEKKWDFNPAMKVQYMELSGVKYFQHI